VSYTPESPQHALRQRLAQLDEEIQFWRAILDRLEAGQAVDRAGLGVSLERLVESSQALRDSIIVEAGQLDGHEVTWNGRAGLLHVVACLEVRDRDRYLRLAEVLAAGSVLYQRERVRLQRSEMRDRAVDELRALYAQPVPPALPGPEIEHWLDWAWSLEEKSPGIVALEHLLPNVQHFLSEVDAANWQSHRAQDLECPPAAIPSGTAAAVVLTESTTLNAEEEEALPIFGSETLGAC